MSSKKKKGMEEVSEPGAAPDVAEGMPSAEKTTLPEQGISSKPIFLDSFLEEHNSFRTNRTMGPAFKAWCRLKDPALLKVRQTEKTWLALFDKFFTREVQ